MIERTIETKIMKYFTLTIPTEANLPEMVKTAPVSVPEKDYNCSNQMLLDDLRDDMLFFEADTHDYVGDF